MLFRSRGAGCAGSGHHPGTLTVQPPTAGRGQRTATGRGDDKSARITKLEPEPDKSPIHSLTRPAIGSRPSHGAAPTSTSPRSRPRPGRDRPEGRRPEPQNPGAARRPVEVPDRWSPHRPFDTEAHKPIDRPSTLADPSLRMFRWIRVGPNGGTPTILICWLSGWPAAADDDDSRHRLQSL